MKRGPKPKSEAAKAAAGTVKPTRVRVPAFAAREEGGWREPTKPTWLSPPAALAWDRKVEEYRLRGQRVCGFEDALAHYCTIEAQLISLASSGQQYPANLLKEYRAYCNEFYDTPASQKVSIGEVLKSDNPFLKIAGAA